jgi:hypothetical protein
VFFVISRRPAITTNNNNRGVKGLFIIVNHNVKKWVFYFFLLSLFCLSKKVTKKGHPKSIAARFRGGSLIWLWYYCALCIGNPALSVKAFTERPATFILLTLPLLVFVWLQMRRWQSPTTSILPKISILSYYYPNEDD